MDFSNQDDSPIASPRHDSLRHEIAAAAAQIVADAGLDYQSAKRKALRQVAGDGHAGSRSLPANDLVDHYLKEHLDLFDPDHASRIARWRAVALHWMLVLRKYEPYLTGAAWKGIIASHAPVHLEVFSDLDKELQMQLLDAGVQFDVDEVEHFSGRGRIPVLEFFSGDVPVRVSLYSGNDLRSAPKATGRGSRQERGIRGDLAAVAALVDAATRAHDADHAAHPE